MEKVKKIANEVPLDVIQLHGDEDVIYIEQLRQQTDKEIWKAVRVKDTIALNSSKDVAIGTVHAVCFPALSALID